MDHAGFLRMVAQTRIKSIQNLTLLIKNEFPTSFENEAERTKAVSFLRNEAKNLPEQTAEDRKILCDSYDYLQALNDLQQFFKMTADKLEATPTNEELQPHKQELKQLFKRISETFSAPQPPPKPPLI
jgi:uncharacterized protein YaaR (DUF327 family)